MGRRLPSTRAKRLSAFEPLDPRYSVRNVMTRSGQTIRGHVFGQSAEGGAQIESVLEGLFALRAQASATVTSYTAQPAQLAIYVHGQKHGYTPDAALQLVTGETEPVEVKYSSKVHTADNLAWLTSVRRPLKDAGLCLRVSTEIELDRPQENELIRRVKVHRKTFHPRETAALNARFGPRQTLKLKEAESLLQGRAALFHLIATKHLFIDYRQPIDEHTVVSRNPGEAKHAIELFHDW